MKHVTVMLKPASSLCNLKCKYCFYTDIADQRNVSSYGMMSPETTQAILQNIRKSLDPGDEITFAFQGGEPTLAGLPYFERFAEIVDAWKGITAHWALQTNGTLLDDAWCAFLRDHKYLVGLSIDLLPDQHDAARTDASGHGTCRQVEDALWLLKRNSVEFNTLTTLTNAIARHPDAVWKRLKALQIQYAQFTPCLGNLDSSEKSPWALMPQRFASFYIRLFSLWAEEFARGHYLSVKLFDDVINLLATGVPSTCDAYGKCRGQIVVEADGSAYPCDFYCLDPYRMGNLTKDTLDVLMQSPARTAFLNRETKSIRLCAECPYSSFCGGGCARMRHEVCGPADARVCGYKTFLDACMPTITQIALRERRARQSF